MDEKKIFNVGDRVGWVSQAGGYAKRKAGTVIAVVPWESRPEHSLPDGYVCSSPYGFGRRRGERSYLIKVDGKGRKAYWPHVRWLVREGGNNVDDRKAGTNV